MTETTGKAKELLEATDHLHGATKDISDNLRETSHILGTVIASKAQFDIRDATKPINTTLELMEGYKEMIEHYIQTLKDTKQE